MIGLGPNGLYKQILLQSVYTCCLIYCLLVTLPEDGDPFMVVSLNRLPSERTEQPRETDLEFIKQHILGKTNREIFQNHEAITFLGEVASDLNINMFAVNFLRNREPNKDIKRANTLKR